MLRITPRPLSPRTTGLSNIASLTGLRFVAAFMIVVLHSYQCFDIPDLRGVLNLGAGVNFFFVLSGFVIAHRYRALKHDEVPMYVVSRLARIYPVHLLSLLAYAAVAAVVFPFQYDLPLHQKALVLLANLSLTQAHIPTPEFYFSINAVSWSLSCELFFYIVAAFVFTRQLNMRRALGVFMAFFLISLACYAFTHQSALSELGTEGQFNLTKVGLVLTWPLTRAHEFFLGVLLQQLHQRCLLRTKRPLLADALGLAVFTISLFGATHLMKSFKLDLVSADFVMTLVCSLGSAFLIWVFSFELSKASTMLFGNPVMVALGEASFALYMLHLPVLRLFQRALPGEQPGLAWWVVYVLTCLTLAHVVHTRFEAPCRQLIIRWYQTRRRSQALHHG